MLERGEPDFTQRNDRMLLRAAVVAPGVVGPCLGPLLRQTLVGLVSLRRTVDFSIEMGQPPSGWPAQPEGWSAERFSWELIGHWRPSHPL